MYKSALFAIIHLVKTRQRLTTLHCQNNVIENYSLVNKSWSTLHEKAGHSRTKVFVQYVQWSAVLASALNGVTIKAVPYARKWFIHFIYLIHLFPFMLIDSHWSSSIEFTDCSLFYSAWTFWTNNGLFRSSAAPAKWHIITSMLTWHECNNYLKALFGTFFLVDISRPDPL